MTGPVQVRVPATSANLGPGFDTLGLALGVHDVVEVDADLSPASAGPSLDVYVEGVGADEVPKNEKNLVVRTVLESLRGLGFEPARLAVRCRNTIPHGGGMGSSAAAIVAGVLAARTLAGAEVTRESVVAEAARLEGHPDNVAPCVLGGFTIAWTAATGVAHAVRQDVHPSVQPVVCIPPVSVATSTARGLLPAAVAHGDAAYTAARAALLVEAVTRRPEYLFDATDERLHQVHRRSAMPDTWELLTALREQGLPAVVSGAGPSVLVLARGDEADVVPALARGWDVRALTVDAAGATIGHGPHDVPEDRPGAAH